MKKIMLLFFVILTLLRLTSAADCFIGIDDYCDPQCVQSDPDCEENPFALQQDANCTSFVDGYCDPNCVDSDRDCFNETAALLSEETVSKPIVEETNLPLGMLGLSFVLFLVIFVLIFQHLKKLALVQKYERILPYGQAMLAKGMSKEYILEQLVSKGYSKKFLKDYFKALEKWA